MDMLKNLSAAFLQAKDSVAQKAQKNSLINKLTNLIKKEKLSCDRAYIALGKYYYNNVREISNPQTEVLCGEIEESEKKIEQAKSHLRKLYSSDEPVKNETRIIEDYAVEDGVIDESIEKISEDELPVD